MRIKSFNEFITEELRKVVSDKSGSGKTKFVDWIWNEPSSDKSPSAGISLRDKLREEEFQDLIKNVPDVSKNFLRKQKHKRNAEKLSVTLNNLKFLKDMQKEDDLYCEYCNKGPLVIYDITEEDLKNGPQKVGGRIRFNTRFNPKDGATVDHKQPQSKGGDKFDYSNLAVCCYSCNQKKKNMSWDDWSQILKIRKVNEARIVDLSLFMKDLTGIDIETLEDNLLEITDDFRVMLRPVLFLIDQNGKLLNNDNGVVSFKSHPNVEIVKIGDKMTLKLIDDFECRLLKRHGYDCVWGWVVEIWRKGDASHRENRICDKSAVGKVFGKVNKRRLEKLELDSAVVLSQSAGSIETDIYSIAIWSTKNK
jgi:hypothetical protein